MSDMDDIEQSIMAALRKAYQLGLTDGESRQVQLASMNGACAMAKVAMKAWPNCWQVLEDEVKAQAWFSRHSTRVAEMLEVPNER